MSGGRRDVEWERSPGMEPDALGDLLAGVLQLPDREPDRVGKVGRVDWSLWLGQSEGICMFDGAPAVAVMLTDVCGPGRLMTVVALCAGHAEPEAWMAGAWREIREGRPGEMAAVDRVVTFRERGGVH